MGKIVMTEQAAPDTPASNRVSIYPKSDGLMYQKDDAGTETLMGGVADASTTVKGKIEIATNAEIIAMTDTARAITADGLGDLLQYQNIYIDAGAMLTGTTNGAESGSSEFTTNDWDLDYFAFDGATEEFVNFKFAMPENWDRGTIKVKFYWAPGDSACSAADTVEWQIAGQAISDDDAIDVALGDAGEVISDTVLAGKDADLHVSGPTPAVTIGGTPALGDLVLFKVSRNVSGTDDMTEDAWLFGCWIQYKVDKAVAAW